MNKPKPLYQREILTPAIDLMVLLDGIDSALTKLDDECDYDPDEFSDLETACARIRTLLNEAK